MFGNNTCIARFFKRRICDIYDKMYRQRAFVHWYLTQGMEEQEFEYAREDIQCLQQEYLEHLHSGGTPTASEEENEGSE